MCGTTTLPLRVFIKGNKIFCSPVIVQELNCVRLQEKRSHKSSICNCEQLRDIWSVQKEPLHIPPSVYMTSTKKSKTLKTLSTKAPEPQNLQRTTRRERESSSTPPNALHTFSSCNFIRKSIPEEYCPYIVQESKGLLLYTASMTWGKNPAIALNLILWAEHTNMGPDKFFRTIKHTGICHYLSCCLVPVVLEEDERIPEAKLGSKGEILTSSQHLALKPCVN